MTIRSANCHCSISAMLQLRDSCSIDDGSELPETMSMDGIGTAPGTDMMSTCTDELVCPTQSSAFGEDCSMMVARRVQWTSVDSCLMSMFRPGLCIQKSSHSEPTDFKLRALGLNQISATKTKQSRCNDSWVNILKASYFFYDILVV